MQTGVQTWGGEEHRAPDRDRAVFDEAAVGLCIVGRNLDLHGGGGLPLEYEGKRYPRWLCIVHRNLDLGKRPEKGKVSL